MARNANKNWNNGDDFDKPDCKVSQEQATRAVLQDIRDELQSIHRILACRNVQAMALATQRIDKRLAKKLPLK